jgi:hypothetical protein
VKVDPRDLGTELGTTCREARVSLSLGETKKVLDDTLTWEQPPGTKEFPVGDLADGRYTLAVTPAGWREPLTGTFERVRFPFEGNTLGITNAVLPPFTPMAVKDSTVSVVLRDYAVDGLGLWRSVKAAGNVSAGGPEELLAAPMALVADGKPLSGAGAFTKTAAHEVVYEGKAEHVAVAVATKCTTEYDGCMKVELTLSPGGQKSEVGGEKTDPRTLTPGTLTSLWLDIPLKDALMPLWHVSTTGLRINPAGATPQGEGAVWDSTKFPDGNWFGSFKCYLWLGAEERGLCWFADNDAGWVLATDAKGQMQPSAGMWARREYLKRIWVLHRLFGPKDALPAMMIHMTNTHIVPYMDWNDENLDLEWKDAPDPAQTKYGHEFLRAESLGRQSGNVPDAIAHAQGKASPEEMERALRTRFGALMVHEIRTGWHSYRYRLLDNVKAFGYGEDDCRVFNYWDARPPVKASDPECKWLLLQKGGELMLLLCTWNPEERDVTAQLDDAALGMKPAQAHNDEKPDEAYAFDGKALKLRLPGYGVALARIK